MAKTIDVAVERKRTPAEAPEYYFVPATDIYETDDELVLVADMPGVAPDGLDVTVEEACLTIRGKPAEEPRPTGDVLLEEFAVGEFYRSFQLPADYDTDKIRAAMRQGVLRLRIPKSEHLKPHRIEVKVE